MKHSEEVKSLNGKTYDVRFDDGDLVDYEIWHDSEEISEELRPELVEWLLDMAQAAFEAREVDPKRLEPEFYEER